jgi:uncharacterized membrane protein YdjX (TVP38/TMEM64 family)
MAVAGAVFWFSPLRHQLDPGALAQWARAQRHQWWAVPAYFAAYAVLNVLFVPTQALSIAAVLIWGWWQGGIIELFAATLAAIPPYLITRGTLRGAVARVERHRALAEVLAREGFTLMVVLRVIPILPYTLLNFVAGLSSLRLPAYVAATFIGMIPSVFIFAYFVDAIARGVVSPRQVMVRMLLAGVLLAALIVATRLAAPSVRRWLARQQRAE